jgi:hypothetical protein
MSTQDDRDLSAAFEELTAPPSTANYATRTSVTEIRTTARRWPQAVATALAVLVAVAGAGTFLALRSARQGGAPASSTGAPPARSGAAMAWDSTAGVTVMFGGAGAAGKPLSDTWTWDGSAWTAAARGPGALADVHMVDDPADDGVLLAGIPAPAADGGSTSSGSGCVVGSATGGSAPRTATGVPGLTPVRPTGPPLSDPLPSASAVPPASTCAPPVAAPRAVSPPAEQTWLFHGGSWNRVASGSSAVAPPAGAQLAFDATTHQVVAVSSTAGCEPPLAATVKSDGTFACPVVGENSGSTGAVVGVPCGVMIGCVTNGLVSTWTWSGGAWAKAPANTVLKRNGVTLVFDDPATHHATLMTQLGLEPLPEAVPCVPTENCAVTATPAITTWSWTGSAWKQVSQLANIQQAPSFAGSTVATIGGHIVVLTTTGQTWTWAAGQWTQETVAVVTHPDMRFGAAMAEGPSGTVVLFGGEAAGGFVTVSPGGSLGSDTWVWNGKAWKHVAGRAPLPPVTTVCPAQGSNQPIPPCVQPEPAQVAPASPAVRQASPSPSPTP